MHDLCLTSFQMAYHLRFVLDKQWVSVYVCLFALFFAQKIVEYKNFL